MDEKKGINALPLKVRIALLALCPILIIALCSGVIILYAGSLVEEGSYIPPAEEVVYLSVAPETDEDRLLAVNTLLEKAQQSGETQITVSNSVDLHSLTSDLTEAQQNLFVYAAGSVEGGMTEMMPAAGLAYGESAAVFTALAAEEVALTPDEQNHVFIYTADVENPFAQADAQLFAQTEEKFAQVLHIDEKQITPSQSTAEIRVDAVADRVQKVLYSRIYNMEYTVTFTGELAELGTKKLTFACTLVSDYTVTFAGITLTKDRLTLGKNGYEALPMQINKAAEAPADSYSLTFTSSDESIATVDESGLVEAVSLSDRSVTVTATLSYLGRTYTDSCEVLVITEPESVKMHSKAQTLQIGERVQLSASVQPEKASIRNIIWYSPDEAVAVVDENGVVTAVGEGKVQIIAVSEIGSYMAGCNITVEGGAG